MSRRMRRGLLVVVTIGAVLLAGAVSAGGKGKPKPPPEPPPSAAYDLTELPAAPIAINDDGDALASNGIVALRSQPVMIPLQGLAGAMGIELIDLTNEDNAGVFLVVGNSVYPDWWQATVWEVNGTTGELLSGPHDPDSAGDYHHPQAFAVNDLGEVAVDGAGGCGVGRPDEQGGFQFVALPAPLVEGVPVYAEPRDINNVGQVIGHAEARGTDQFVYAVLWQMDNATGEYLEPVDLGTLTPGVRSEPVAINDCGQVVGYASVGGATFQAWLIDPRDMDGDGAPEWFWDSDGNGVNDLMIALGPGGAATQPWDVNNAGQVVGTYKKGNKSQGGTDGFIWESGVMTLLRDLVPSEYSEWYLPAYCVNDRGQIGGNGRSGSKWGGWDMAYLLTPRP